MSKVYKIVVVVIIALGLVPLMFVRSCVIKENRYNQGHPQVEVGQSKQSVIELLGEPSEVQSCYGPVYDDYGRVTGECAEKYYYHSFLESWGVLFDKDGTVIEKFYTVSG